MIKLFKKFQNNEVVVKESNPNLKSKTSNEIIKEIHEAFYTEVDKLFTLAKNVSSLDTDKQELIEKSRRLKALGFINTKEVKDADDEIARLDKVKQDNEDKITLIEAINYFTFKYPNYKFITEKSVEKICSKYNLIYDSIDKYIGTVPDENLKHIENFKVHEDDECYVYEKLMWSFHNNNEISLVKEYVTGEKFKIEETLSKNNDFYQRKQLLLKNSIREINMKCPLEIAAPLNYFNTQGMEIKEFKISKIEIPDPIVLKPVIFKKQKYYLIVTAWGIEAGDEIVVNPYHN